MLLDGLAHALAEALEYDDKADYAHLPTPVVAEWLAQADPESGMLPRVHASAKRQRKPEDVRRFARTTASACLSLRWVLLQQVNMGDPDDYKITAAGRAALQRYVHVAAPKHLARRGVA